MTVCGEKVTGVCVAGKCQHIKCCCPVVWDKYGKIKPKTNEEWLRSATFEEMAGAIYEWYTFGYTMGTNGIKLNSITGVVEWLQKPHREE